MGNSHDKKITQISAIRKTTTLLQQQKSTTYGVEDPITDLRYIVTG
jgi:hypothetical protein